MSSTEAPAGTLKWPADAAARTTLTPTWLARRPMNRLRVPLARPREPVVGK